MGILFFYEPKKGENGCFWIWSQKVPPSIHRKFPNRVPIDIKS